MAGATQWKAPCPHIEERPSDVCLHSEISWSNVDKWESERLPEGVSESELRTLLTIFVDDATIAVCNSCRRINWIGSGGVEVLHSGDPHFNDRVGEWQIDLEEEANDDNGFGNSEYDG
jgi:hypothetical protein